MTFVLSRPQEDNILCTAEHEQEMVGLVANHGGNRNAMTNRAGGSGQSTGGSNANSHNVNANVNANANQQHGHTHTPNPYSVAPTLALYRTRSRPEHRRGKPHAVLALWRTLKHRPWCAVALVVGLLATVAFVPALLSPAAAPAPAAPPGGGAAGSIPPHKPLSTGDGRGPSLLARREGSVRLGRGGGGRSIGYTHQPASTKHKDKDDQPRHHLVLLHGAAFSRADWGSFGILDLFRKKHPWLAVTALDLPVSAGYADLFEVLDLLAKTDADTDGGEGAGPVLRSLPVSALVTPSASGRTVTSWIQSVSSDSSSDSSNGREKAEAPTDYFRLWIPVACYSVQKCTKGQLEGALAEGNGPLQGDTEALRVMAIYGDKDPKGKTVSEKLGESLPRSTVLELPGGHPVYRDSPDAFVDAVAAEIAGLP